MRTVLACIDNSAAAQPVLRAALAIAPLFGAVVDAVHVAEDGEATAGATALAVGVPLRTLHGDVVDVLASLAERADVVAVTVGARSRPTASHPVGHVALQLVERAGSPVMVVPPDAVIPDRIRRVLVAMEGTAANARNLQHAVELAAGAELELVVVHVDAESSIPSFSDQVQHETDAYASEFLARYAPGAPLARLELRIGVPADEILSATESLRADAIAIGHRSTAGAGHGEVVREVLERSHVPVLVVATA